MAYAAVASLIQTTEQILQPNYKHHSLHDKTQISFLHKKLSLLLDFLEDYSQSSREALQILESRIRDACFAAEDIIESHISNQYLWETKRSCFWQLICVLEVLICPPRPLTLEEEYKYLEKEIEEIDSILEEVMTIKDRNYIRVLQPRSASFCGTSRSTPMAMKTMVGFDQELIQLKDRLTGQQSQLQIIPIVGMGGIGKTTLARNLYEDKLIVQWFYIHAWVTISQEYRVHDILLSILRDIQGCNDQTQLDSREKISECVYKSLKGRRYLIVMDDVWDTKIWDEVKKFFPDDNYGSRIMLTTRLLNVASYVNSHTTHHQMRFLNEDESWTLLSHSVFAQEPFAQELEESGKRIAKNCQGLPLAILVIGGLLSKVSRTVMCWENISENVSSAIARNNEQCSKILSLSYNYLPPHLKPCFLYMGFFPKDYVIRASRLIKFWVAEGFLKRTGGRSLEEVAEENLQDLIDRNLVSVRQHGSNGKMKTCNIHDLLRDLCLREAHKERFFSVLNGYVHTFSDCKNNPRRLVVHQNTAEGDQSIEVDNGYTFDLLKCMPLARSFVWVGHYCSLPSFYCGFRLMKVLHIIDSVFNEFPIQILELVNLRYLALKCYGGLPSSIAALENLQCLIFYQLCPYPTILPSVIWMMPQLRHLLLNDLQFPAPDHWENNYVLENLQTLSFIRVVKWNKKFLERVPNLKKLGVSFSRVYILPGVQFTPYSFMHLQKLETLKCNFDGCVYENVYQAPLRYLEPLVFPPTLKKLTLRGCCLPWAEMSMVGRLCHLEVLKLRNNAFDGEEWMPVDGEFCELKFLLLESSTLKHWHADSIQFPRLESLILRKCTNLEEIPSDIGEIPTLQLIDLQFCSPSSVISANLIREEQHNMGNTGLEVRIC